MPYESARTTGTVAVAKWGRVTLLSPRASHHGYPWRDTIAHELTHLAVTRASQDRAPLWLQEGIAKREEVRWRDPGPFDDRPPPEDVVRRGLELGLAVGLDKLGPSIAMLPSADAATVAFAEVTSFVRFYAQAEGGGGADDALPRLLAELRQRGDPDEALSAASGVDLKTWDERWRAYLSSRPPVAARDLFGLNLGPIGAKESKGGAVKEAREARRLRELRDRARLAQLLLGRSHAPEALTELDRIELAAAPVSNDRWDRAMGDPSVRWLRGRALEEAGRREEGESLMADPAQVFSGYGPWWATRGRWARLRGDEGVAEKSFDEAVAADPLDDEAACETIDPKLAPPDPAIALLVLRSPRTARAQLRSGLAAAQPSASWKRRGGAAVRVLETSRRRSRPRPGTSRRRTPSASCSGGHLAKERETSTETRRRPGSLTLTGLQRAGYHT